MRNRRNRPAQGTQTVGTNGRSEQASIVDGLTSLLEEGEQLLGFTRAWIGGGVRGKLLLGPEAFLSPILNVGLTDRGLLLQHVRSSDGKPANIPPHRYPMENILHIQFLFSETFGGSIPAGRLTIQLSQSTPLRLRIWGKHNVKDAQAMAEVFRAFLASHRIEEPSLWHTCASCGEKTDQLYRFCPYCGQSQAKPLEESQSSNAPNNPQLQS